MPRILAILLIAVLLFSATVELQAQQSLKIATKETPPFVMKREDGSWYGITIDLWRQIAEELKLTYEFTETDLDGMVRGLSDGSYDVAVAALTVTAERERMFDFTHPFFATGLTIATARSGSSNWFVALRKLWSPQLIKSVGSLALVLLLVGFLVWMVERKANPDEFGGGPMSGLWSGFWFSAVTMTTVGYGDKSPKTVTGRILALIWMFMAIIIISGFTAAIAAAFTVTQLESQITGPEDLVGLKVGSVPNSTSAHYLESNNINYIGFESAAAGVKALGDKELDAFVYDRPILRYLVNKSHSGRLRVLPNYFERQDYAIALKEGSPLREAINQVLLRRVQSPDWERLLTSYLGD